MEGISADERALVTGRVPGCGVGWVKVGPKYEL